MSDSAGRMTGFPQQQQQLMQPVFLPATASRQPLPKQLTAAIKSCASLERLTQLFHAHQAVLNPIHIAAMITKLPKLDTSMHNAAVAAGADLPWVLSTASAQQVQLWQLLQQLLMRLKAQGCSEYSPRGVANIIWALAKLQCAPDPELRHTLLDKFCSELASAVPQDISNVLWGVAKLTKERTAVLTNSTPMMGSAPGVMQTVGLAYSSPSANSSPSLGGGSGLSMQDWALSAVAPPGHPADSALGAGGAPLLAQDQVRLLLQHLCQQLHAASVQTISNSLWAVVVLQQEHQWCMCNCLAEVQALLSVFCKQPQQALPGHIQPVIRCMAQLATTCSNHAGDSWLKWQAPLLQQLLGYLCSQREHMEMHHVSSVLRDVAQVVCLHLLLAKQIRDADQQQQQPRTSRTGSATEACPLRSSGGQPGSEAGAGSRAATVVAVPSLNTIQAEDEAEEVLARLAATGGPQDASSTVVALAMLRPQLEQLGLQYGVAGLCSLLPTAALPHLGEEAGQRLLAAATSLSGAGAAATAVAKAGSNRLHVILPDEQQQQAGSLQSVVLTPNAGPGSSSEGNSSSSNIESSSTAAPGSTVVIVSNPGLHPAGLGSSTVSVMSGDSSRSLGNPVPASSPTAAAAAAGLMQLTPLTPSHNPGDSPAEIGQPGSLTAAGHNPGHSPGSNPTHSPPGDHPTADPAVDPVPPAGAGFTRVGTLETSSTAAAAAANEGPASEVATDDPPGMSIPGDSQEEAAARQLTHNIAYADSVYQLTEIFHAHSSVMDMIHISACITRLSKVMGTAPSASAQAAATALLPLLGAKLLQVLPHANARGIANVLWGYGRLKNLLQSDLIPKLVEAFLQQMPNAACRDSAVVLWSLARLSEAHGLAHMDVQTDLLQRLGTAVLEQLAAAAGSHQRQQQPGGSSSSTPLAVAEGSSEVPQTLSSRDVSNSLMALARLGFSPDLGAQGAAVGAVAANPAAAGTTTATSAIAAQLDVLSLETSAETVAAATSSDQQQLHGAGVVGTEQPPHPPAAASAAVSGLRPLTLPLKPIELLVQYLLQNAATAKTLDLQEAATALKQLGLHDLHSQVVAAIVTPPPGSMHGATYFAGQHPGVHYGHYGAGGLQYIHHHMAAGSSGSSASPMIARYGGSGPSSQGSAAAAAARPARPAGSSAVSVPGAINLSGTQLAGLLQQQRRQQPLPVSGPAYGAGWLGQQQQRPPVRPPPGPPSLLQQQQQQRMMGGSSGRPGAPAAAAGGGTVRSGVDMPPSMLQARRSQEGSYPAAAFRSRATLYQAGYTGQLPGQAMQAQQYQRQQQQQQRQLQLQMQGQQQHFQQQQGNLAHQQQQQQQPMSGVQYMFLPQQQIQQQIQQGGYVLQQPQQQQQQAQIQQQQQQQQQAAAGQLYVVPSSMAQYVNVGQQGAALFGGVGAQQAGVATAVAGSGQDSTYILQGGIPQQQQQQQAQQQVQVLPALQVQAALQGQAVGPYAVTSGLLMGQDFAQLDSQQQQQQVQLYSMVGGSGALPQLQQQQQGQEPPGLYLQQQPQQQQQQQLMYQGGLVLDPASGYVQGGLLPGGQFQ